jgi:hypothetical protein
MFGVLPFCKDLACKRFGLMKIWADEDLDW